MSTADVRSIASQPSPPASAAPRQQPSAEEISEEGSFLWDLLADVPAWGMSLLIHCVILLLLASYTLPVIFEDDLSLTSEIAPEVVREEELVIDNELTEEVVGSNSDLNIVGASLAAAQTMGLDNHQEQVERLEERLVDPRLPELEDIPTPNEAEMLEPLDLTGTTEHAGGTKGAVDRIAQEIAASLRERRTLVVWLFDESLSLEKRREEIAARFDKIYGQLDTMNVDTEGALRSAVMGYGKGVHFLQKDPTNDTEKLVSAVNSIVNDESGEERVFTAINEALRVYIPEKRKLRASMMLIVVTDERGDDYAALETVVGRCAREGVRAYCVGNAAVFGREKGHVRYTWEFEGEEITRDIPVDQGPETIIAEGLQLPFWTARAQGLERMSAGYGPYTLSRLCNETGGIYFVAEDSLGRKFDSLVMRPYTPDYRPLRQYQNELVRNTAKQALVAAAAEAGVEEEGGIPIPVRRFRAENDNILRQEITEAQKPLATLDYFLQRLQSLLEAGEKDRPKLDSPRWRASYDLAMGRVLAMRVRAYGYNTLLAEMKSSPKSFEREGSNHWRLEPSEDVDAGATVRRMHKKAITYLSRVIDEHPGTPWAFLAEMEMSDPLGWEWVEMRIEPPQNNMGNGNGNRGPQFAPEEERRRQEQRRRMQRINQNIPKL